MTEQGPGSNIRETIAYGRLPHPRLLIIHEDEEAGRHMATLAQRIGVQALTVTSESMGLAAVAGMDPDSVVLSLTVRENAFGLARQLRARAAPRRVRIVAMSRVGGTLPGAAFDAVMVRPITAQGLRYALKLERRQDSTASRMSSVPVAVAPVSDGTQWSGALEHYGTAWTPTP